MNGSLLFILLILNVLISIWNCYAVGSAWKDTKAMGSGFEKILLYSAMIEWSVGFSMPILIGLAYGLITLLTGGDAPTLSPEQGKQVLQAIFNLWYVAVIFPILGSGLAIWAHSMREAYRNRDFTSFAGAGWNSYAQISNTVSACENLGGAFGNLGEFFGIAFEGGNDNDGLWLKIGLFVFLLVILALVAGFMIALTLVRHFARQTPSRLEEYGQHMRRTSHA